MLSFVQSGKEGIERRVHLVRHAESPGRVSVDQVKLAVDIQEDDIHPQGRYCLLRLHIEKQKATILIQNGHLVTVEPQFGSLKGQRESTHSLAVVVQNPSTVLLKLIETFLIWDAMTDVG